METPWGEMPVCDAHVHFFSHRFFSSFAEQKQLPLRGLETLLGWQIPDSNPAHLADRWIEELDRWGVRRAALIASIPGDHERLCDDGGRGGTGERPHARALFLSGHALLFHA